MGGGVCTRVHVPQCIWRFQHSLQGLVVFVELGSLLFVLLQLVLNSGQPACELWVFLFPLPISP